MLTLHSHGSIDAIAASDWDALAADSNPFVSHAFLSGLESTGCIREEFGWRAQHLTLHDGDALVGALPLYVKANSHGEYVFDWGWADAWERAGGQYYPKFLCAVPYSPVTGPRLLTGAAPNAGKRRATLAAALRELTERTGLSSVHVDFLREEETTAFDDAWLARSDWQFQWRNPGDWRDFDDYLAALTHKRRNAIRHERAQVADARIDCEFRDGGTLDDAEWRTMHHLYTNTFDEKGNTPTLSLDFFRHLGTAFPGHSHVAFARRHGEIVAGALFLSGKDVLYGRYWGARQEVPGMHFELCYYQGIEQCLRRGLARFEPGAQGLHKLARGFLPTRTHSRHYITDDRFREAVRSALRHEAAALEARGRELRAHSPFAQRDGAP
ncbi:MAG TPA: GNAT family N-acetyltransferase [Rhodanobacteraceae bacterium]|jgi:predicted N-acyltransferase|nr:GNAT family N-acetyltransferase [Rhodanobacteraceae bacterium]